MAKQDPDRVEVIRRSYLQKLACRDSDYVLGEFSRARQKATDAKTPPPKWTTFVDAVKTQWPSLFGTPKGETQRLPRDKADAQARVFFTNRVPREKVAAMTNAEYSTYLQRLGLRAPHR